jgi:hypothetical protein
LVNFDNMQSVEGMEELFRAKSLRALVDVPTQSVALFVLAPEEIDKELKAEHTQVKVMQMGKHHATQHIVKPQVAAEPILAAGGPKPQTAQPIAPLPPSFEHLEAVERLCPSLVDLFIKHGQLISADKDALKAIKPMDSSLEARVVALERWQAELVRRLRAMSVPKPTRHLVLGGIEAQQQERPEEALPRRFDTLLQWLGKLIKAFEATGVRYHNKPVWLPH